RRVPGHRGEPFLLRTRIAEWPLRCDCDTTRSDGRYGERRDGLFNRRSMLRLMAVVAALGLVAGACSKKSSTSGAKSVKIAFQGALTGGPAQLVVPGYNGAKLAFAQANAGKFGKLPVTIQLVQ